jgi:MbtH protein
MADLTSGTAESDEDARAYVVVRNDEDQYSIWLVGRDIPEGWHDEGITGPKPVCLEYIEQAWTDMRPRSLRLAMAAHQGDGPGA